MSSESHQQCVRNKHVRKEDKEQIKSKSLLYASDHEAEFLSVRYLLKKALTHVNLDPHLSFLKKTPKL